MKITEHVEMKILPFSVHAPEIGSETDVKFIITATAILAQTKDIVKTYKMITYVSVNKVGKVKHVTNSTIAMICHAGMRASVTI